MASPKVLVRSTLYASQIRGEEDRKLTGEPRPTVLVSDLIWVLLTVG
jgi:hypothetical protein